MAKHMIGIDIGSDRIKIAAVDGRTLKSCISEKLPDNLVKNGSIVSWDAMADEIRSLVRKNGISEKNAAIAMPTDEVYIRTAELPLMTVQQLKVNLPYEFHDYITEDMDKYVYDYSVAGIDDRNMKLTAVAAGKELIQNYMAMCKRAKLNLKILSPAAMSLGAVLKNYENSRGIERGSRDYALLDLGNANVKINFFTRGQYEVTRVMDVGIGHLTEVLAGVRGNDPHLAQLELEQNRDAGEIPELTDVYEDIAVRIMRVLNFYSFNNPNNNIDVLYYYGGGANLSRLLETIHETIQLPMEKASFLLPESLRANDGSELICLQAIGSTMAED